MSCQPRSAVHLMITAPCKRILLLVIVLPTFMAAVLVLPLREVTGVLVPEVGSAFSCGGRGSLLRSQPCLSAAPGLILSSGSHSRHLRKKSRNRGSSHLRARFRSLEPGGPRSFPRLECPPCSTVVPSARVDAVQYRGNPFELMKFFDRFPNSIRR